MKAITDDYMDADNAVRTVKVSNILSIAATKQPAKCYPCCYPRASWLLYGVAYTGKPLYSLVPARGIEPPTY